MIYTEFWGLEHPPFAEDGGAGIFIPTQNASLALARLRYAIGSRMGAAGLFGEAGCGKTKIARILLQEFSDANWLTGYLPSPAGTPGDILAALDPEANPKPGSAGMA